MAYNKYCDIKIRSHYFNEDVKPLIAKIRPTWDLNFLKIKKQTGGVSNVLFAVSNLKNSKSVPKNERDVILVRVYGEMLINRDIEMDNMAALSRFNLAARVWGQFANGCCYQFIHGTVMDLDHTSEDWAINLIINEMVELHCVELELTREKKPFIFDKIREFACNLPDCLSTVEKTERYRSGFPSKLEFFKEVEEFELLFRNVDCPITFCHNDLLVRNLILNIRKDRIHFIDFEYADYNYSAFDIGNHFNEFAGLDDVDYSLFPTKDFQLKWIRQYLETKESKKRSQYQQNGHHPPMTCGSEIDDETVFNWYKLANKCSLLSHLLWCGWSIWQDMNSEIEFGYLDYAIKRWAEFRRRKHEVLSL